MNLKSLILLMLFANLLFLKLLPAASYVSNAQIAENQEPVFQKGMSYTTYANLTPGAYNSVESDESLRRMRQIGVEWVAINVVGWYQTNETSADIHRNPSQASTDEALAYAIEIADSLGMEVMLKPMIDLQNGVWRGKIQPSEKWFQNYTNYIDSFAEFAEQHGVQMFCLGTEYEQTTSWTQQWKSIISEVRSLFHGNLTYAAVWGELFNVHFWSDLDYAGLDAYYHLSNTNNPTISEMTAKFESDSINIETWYAANKIPIIFTEIGYLSTDGTNQEPSTYQLQYDMQRKTDLQEQADCYEATFQAVWNKRWLHGMYWWY